MTVINECAACVDSVKYKLKTKMWRIVKSEKSPLSFVLLNGHSLKTSANFSFLPLAIHHLFAFDLEVTV